MTWRNLTHLVLFMVLCIIHPSEEGCKDYFTMVKEISNAATVIIPLVKPKDSKDTLKCTVESACRKKIQNEIYCHILYYCFEVEKNHSEECSQSQENTFHNVPHFHLMCLLAHAFNVTTPVCEYVTTCEMYSAKSSAAPTAATTVTAATTTATSAAATPTNPLAATVNPESLASSGCKGEFSQTFCISLAFNILFILGGIIVCCMRHRGLLNSSHRGKAKSSEAEFEGQAMMRNSEEECSSES